MIGTNRIVVFWWFLPLTFATFVLILVSETLSEIVLWSDKLSLLFFYCAQSSICWVLEWYIGLLLAECLCYCQVFVWFSETSLFDPVAFLSKPSVKSLYQLKKEHLINLAGHLNVDIKSSLKKAEIKKNMVVTNEKYKDFWENFSDSWYWWNF